MSPEVQTLLRRYHKEVESRMDKLFAQQAIAEKYAELSRKRQMHQDLQSEKDKHWKSAKEYKLVATPADFEEQYVDYDVEGAWKKLRAAHADECWKFIQRHQNMYRAHLERFCAPAYVQQEAVDQVTSLLSRHPQLYDASALEEQCARVKAWAQLVVRQSFVVNAEQLRVKQQKEKCRQRTLESAQAEYEAMDARSFVVALQLEAAGSNAKQQKTSSEGSQPGTLTNSQRWDRFSSRGRTCSKPMASKSGQTPAKIRVYSVPRP